MVYRHTNPTEAIQQVLATFTSLDLRTKPKAEIQTGQADQAVLIDTMTPVTTSVQPGVFVVSSNHTGETGHWVSVDDNSSFYKGWGWNHFGIAEILHQTGDSAYVIVDGPTWEEAEANANALGGHLVTINDSKENEWMNRSINEMLGLTWIGLRIRTAKVNGAGLMERFLI